VLCLSLILASLSAPPGADAAEKTVIIGFTASKTGKLNVEATRQINGLHLWMEQVNKAGGVKLADGTVVKFADKFYDDESKKERVQELYKKKAWQKPGFWLPLVIVLVWGGWSCSSIRTPCGKRPLSC